MNVDDIVQLATRALLLVLLLSAPAVLAGLVVGLAVSVFQAATQIQEQTLAIAPKLLAIYVALGAAGYWLAGQLVAFAREVFGGVAMVG